jgi:NAD(P)-dependent dehydrogenase (short-subunit alcohol dehydrogenase family)
VVALNRTLLKEPWLHEIECDLADPGAVHDAVAAAVAYAGRLDACVSSAVTRHLAPVASLSLEDWNESVAVNLTSVFALAQAALPALRASAGIILVLGSHAGSRFFETGAAYSATKAALKALVETLLLEERPHGVVATLITPGAIANVEGDADPRKMSTASVARYVGHLVQDRCDDVVVGEVEIRPARLPPPPVAGLARLLHV